jgi:hypothetical protein
MENTKPDMMVIEQEIFGPVVCAPPFDDDEHDSPATLPGPWILLPCGGRNQPGGTNP